MALRTRVDRDDRAAPKVPPDRPAPNCAAHPGIVAALRFCGLGFDHSRLTELRRRTLRSAGEAAR